MPTSSSWIPTAGRRSAQPSCAHASITERSRAKNSALPSVTSSCAVSRWYATANESEAQLVEWSGRRVPTCGRDLDTPGERGLAGGRRASEDGVLRQLAFE